MESDLRIRCTDGGRRVMYLVGDLSDREYFKGLGMLKLKSEITKEDLAKAKNDEDFQVINIMAGSYYDPGTNLWVEFDR